MPRRAFAIFAVILVLFPVSMAVRGDSGINDYWKGGLHLNTPIYGRPDGILQDGGPLNERIEGGNMGQNYLESIYLATGTYHHGIVAIDPKNGTLHRDQPSDVLPSDFGGIYAAPLITSENGNPEHNGTLYLVSDTGKIAKINASVIWKDGLGSDAHIDVYHIEYRLMWVVDVGDGIHRKASIYGDREVLVVTDNGTLLAYSKNGTKIWSIELNGSEFFSPVPDEHDGMVILANRAGEIYGINATRGSIAWENRTDNISGITISSRYRNTGRGAPLLTSTETGKLVKMSPKDGTMKKTLILWDSCPASEVFTTHDGGLIYVGVSVKLNGTWIGKSRIYAIYADDMRIKWYQNVTGNVSSAPRYYDTGSTYLLTDAGYFYEFDESGLISARFRMGNSSGFSPVYAPYIPGFIEGGIIVALKNGDIFEFSKKIEYYGSSVEPLEWNEEREPEVPWHPGQSWAYKWLMDFGKDSKNQSYYYSNYGYVNYSMNGTDGGYSKYLLIKYTGKDEYGYRFDFKGGAYAKGNISIGLFASSNDGGYVGKDEYTVEINQYDSTFKGSFWLKYDRYANANSMMEYFGVWRESLDLSYVLRVHIKEENTLWSYSYEKDYVSNESVIFRNLTLKFTPSIPFYVMEGSDFSGGIYCKMNYSGNIFSEWSLEERPKNMYGGPFNFTTQGFKSGNSTFPLSSNVSGSTKLLPPIPWVPEAVESGRHYGAYATLSFMSVLGKPGNELYEEIDAPFPISAEMAIYSLYLNSTNTTEDEVDDYLRDKAAYTPGIEENGENGGLPLILEIGIAIIIAVLVSIVSLIVLLSRKKSIK